jgi:hypothetical protein
MTDCPPEEQLRETLVKYFLETCDEEKGKFYANLLLDCTYQLQGYVDEEGYHYWHAIVKAHPQAFEYYKREIEDWRFLQSLIMAALPDYVTNGVELALKRQEGAAGWDQGVRQYLAGDYVDNQGAAGKSPILDDLALRYKSHAEVAVSKALRKAGVLFFPLPVAVMTINGKSYKREPDFLICDEGRWGVLEVQGDSYHLSATKDHERAETLQRHGIKYVRFYDSKECHQDPDGVVRKFRHWLKTMYQTP